MLDSTTKILAVSFLKGKESIGIISDFFKFSYVENTGAAFGNFFGQNQKLLLLTILCVIFILLSIRSSKVPMEIFGFFLILTGAIGNLLDRLFRGYVVDFMDFDFFNIQIEPKYFFPGFSIDRWPVFNFADSYIFIGAIIVIIAAFYYSKHKEESP